MVQKSIRECPETEKLIDRRAHYAKTANSAVYQGLCRLCVIHFQKNLFGFDHHIKKGIFGCTWHFIKFGRNTWGVLSKKDHNNLNSAHDGLDPTSAT